MRALTTPLLASLALVVVGCGEPDKDKDGFVASADCNDNDAAINADAEEICDGVDNNCDGLTDDDESVVDGTTWFLDRDIDGFGDDDVTTTACSQPLGTWAIEGGDCDDTDPGALPGGQEICNGKDDDCDGTEDEAEEAEGTVRVYEDYDFDSFGDPETGVDLCPNQVPTLWVDNGDDCNDEDKAVYPGAPEYCNEQDDDCDSVTDELDEVVDGFDAWVDDDGDGYGQPGTDMYVCFLPSGYADRPGDCNDDDDVVALGCGCTTSAAEDLRVTGTVSLEGGEHQFGELYVASGATLRFTGNLPTYVFAESIVVEGTIDGAAKGTEPGPGGGAGGSSRSCYSAGGKGGNSTFGGGGGSPSSSIYYYTGGGGGGGNADDGGAGESGTYAAGGAGGARFGDQSFSEFFAGGGGGAGGHANGGRGGGGGGAIKLVAGTIDIPGTIDVRGANGGSAASGCYYGGGGGGGGAGGSVWIHGDRVEFTGEILIEGGAGGSGLSGSYYQYEGTDGGGGSVGRVRISGQQLVTTGRVDGDFPYTDKADPTCITPFEDEEE